MLSRHSPHSERCRYPVVKIRVQPAAVGGLVGRRSSVARVILAGVVVDHVAFEEVGDVWDDYQQESKEPSARGFLEWVSELEFRDLLDDRGWELFPECADELDVSQRTARDVLEVLRYFRM